MQTGPAVILTQEPEANRELGTLLSQHGFSAISYPCIEIKLYPFNEAMLPAGRRLSAFKLVAFTSKRAVAAMAGYAQQLRESGTAVACVGRGTARSVKEHLGLECTFIPENETGEELGKLILASFAESVPLLHPRGNKSSGAMQALLTEAGWEVCEVVVYENLEPRLTKLEVTGQMVAVFASPSAVTSFFGTNPELVSKATCISIGPSTAKRLEEIGIARIVQSSDASMDGLARAVVKTVSKGVVNG